MRDDLGESAVSVSLMGPTGFWEPAARWAGTATIRGAAGPMYRRGYVRGGDSLDIGDAIYLLNFLFASGPAPECLAAADVNGDDGRDVGDAVYLLNYLFANGPAPPEPFAQPAPCPGG